MSTPNASLKLTILFNLCHLIFIVLIFLFYLFYMMLCIFSLNKVQRRHCPESRVFRCMTFTPCCLTWII